MSNNARSNKYVMMISTSGRGGMRSVVDGYEQNGVFQRWHVRTLFPHVEGGLTHRILAAARALIHFIALLVLRKVKLVHCHVAMRGSFWRKSLFAELARLFGVPTVFHLHGSEMKPFFSSQGMLGQRLITRQLERVDRVLVLSESWKVFIEYIAPSAKVTILSNYVMLPPWSACRQRHDGINVIFLGLLGHRKGIFELLDAFKQARAHVPGIKLMVGGNGDIERVMEFIKVLKLEDLVRVLGWVSGDDKKALLETGDVFVLPSHNEGLPISILEAMSWGIPIISTRVGGIPELVRDDQDGILIDAGDVSALAAALERLGLDERLRAKMGLSARTRVEKSFSQNVVLPKLDNLYMELIEGDLEEKGPAEKNNPAR